MYLLSKITVLHKVFDACLLIQSQHQHVVDLLQRDTYFCHADTPRDVSAVRNLLPDYHCSTFYAVMKYSYLSFRVDPRVETLKNYKRVCV